MLLKTKPICLALLFFITPALYAAMLFLNIPASSHFKLLLISVFIGWIAYLVWLWLTAKQLQNHIKSKSRSLYSSFKKHFITMIILNHIVLPICLFWDLCSGIGHPSHHYTIYVVYLITIACAYVYVAMCYFISQMLLLYSPSRKNSISSDIRTLFLFLFIFIGIWFIQPKIQRLSQYD